MRTPGVCAGNRRRRPRPPLVKTGTQPSSPARVDRTLTLVAAAAWLWPSAQEATTRHRHPDTASDEQLVSLTHAQRDLQQNAPTDHATKPIEQIKVGERVLAHNPEVSEEERASWTEPDWSDWLQLSLVMPKEDGSELKIELLRSDDWVRSQLNFVVDEKTDAEITEASPAGPTSQIAEPTPSVPLSPLRPIYRDLALTDLVIEEAGLELVGLTAEMDLPELAITGPAVIVDLRSAPQIQPGAGRVVTATFHHTSGDVIDLTIGDKFSTETIGTTGNHPFWSEDRQGYVQAATLEIGEQVRTHAGDTKQVVSLLPRPGPEAVFNLEVHGEHVYWVGTSGVLVHNTYPDFDEIPANLAHTSDARLASGGDLEGLTLTRTNSRTEIQFKGDVGEQLSIGQGGIPIGFQVPVRAPSGRVTILDSVEVDPNTGRFIFVESKNGPGAKLSDNQIEAHDELKLKGGTILRSHRHANDMIAAFGEYGFKPGRIDPSQFTIRVDKFNTGKVKK
ncbi:MAG: hypothetical protein KDB00_07140 [Planctomycetales bacterium]|nr:hypothetical protein [Planctomycetales bacterium]